MMKEVFSTEFAGRTISLKANYVAAQADGAILATYGDTVALVTAVSLKSGREGIDFMPLTVDYQEMTYAAGKFPGGFFKREGRLNEREVLTSRMIDRSIRPLFPKGYTFETQLVATLLSADRENDGGVAAMLAASAALEISNIPFKGPIAGVRVGRLEGQLVCNPSQEAMKLSDFNLFLVGRKVSSPTSAGGYDVNLVMLEGEAREVDEDVLVDAINFGLENLRPVIDLQDRMREAIGKEKRAFAPAVVDEGLVSSVTDAALRDFEEAYRLPRKQERYSRLDQIREQVIAAQTAEDSTLKGKVAAILENLERRVIRTMVLKEKTRIDGRSSAEIRPISAEVGLLPRTHGSALFNRGETQALAVVTLGTSSDEQRMDFVSGEERRAFLLHYNFPPYCVGEAKPL
ncbi:MAG: polyribonucleotide nucleotidyltransferase, partial [Deltaproteobacteria bacterium]|nr:polyribonucleotide nucleotidyltransferase [Deltaproteobacteria bacterium]